MTQNTITDRTNEHSPWTPDAITEALAMAHTGQRHLRGAWHRDAEIGCLVTTLNLPFIVSFRHESGRIVEVGEERTETYEKRTKGANLRKIDLREHGMPYEGRTLIEWWAIE